MIRILGAAGALGALVFTAGCLAQGPDGKLAFTGLAAADSSAGNGSGNGLEGAGQPRPGFPPLAEIPAPRSAPAAGRMAPAHTLSDAFSEVARVATPAVVSLEVDQEARRPQAEPFGQFFGPPPSGQRIGRGSGAIVDPRGLVITNNHVVEGATEIRVTLADDRELEATVVGTDPPTDLAVLRLESEGEVFPHVGVGDSDALRVGDFVLAIGNPLGNSHSVTAGIVSAKGRVLGGDYQDYIQTDAAINPGNSGGPLLDLNGRLVGVNTVIQVVGQFGGAPGNIGIGFAIPSNLVRRVYDDLAADGRVVRGWLGVQVRPVGPQEARAFDLDEGVRGAIILDYSGADSPARAAGLRSGDVIVRFAGRPIEDSADLQFAVADTRPGERADVEFLREGERRTAEVVLAERHFEDAAAAEAAPSMDEEAASRFGLAGETLTEALAARIRADFEGVLVRRVAPGGAAAEAGIQPGQVIIEVDGRSVANNADLREALSGIRDGETFPVWIARPAGPGEWVRGFVIVEAPE